MSAMRTGLAIAAVALVAAACERKPAGAPAPRPAPPAAAPAAPAGPAAPLSFRLSTPDAQVVLTLPPQVAAIPALYSKLYSEGRNSLQAFADGAKGDLDEQRANGDKPAPYRQTLDYTLSAETGRLVGLQAAGLEDTGAEHPIGRLKGLIWDKAAGKEVKASDLFAPGADMTAADKVLCDAIHAAKKARTGDGELTGDLKACPALKAAALTLAPSAVPGKAGGLIALFPPFALGGATDGAFRIPVPAETVRPLLDPAYAAEFAGPAPGGG